MSYSDLSVALISVLNRERKYPVNKDLNGGIGTYDHFGDSWSSRFIQFMRKKVNRIPIIGFAHLHAIFLAKGVSNIRFFEGTIPQREGQEFNLILIFGSIVDYRHENEICRNLKREYPQAKIGFFGMFPTKRPDLFRSGDFVIVGEAEAFFVKGYSSLRELEGAVLVTQVLDMNELPVPNFDDFPLRNYSYRPGLISEPFVTMQGSKGCPYSCSFYCTYGAFQGSAIRQRSPQKLVGDIVEVQEKYGIESIQFRDPIFGLRKGFIDKFCSELSARDVKIKWGMETRLDLLNEHNISKMFDVGLRLINVGIETRDPYIAKQNKRNLVEEDHQRKMINYCYRKGVKVSAFYILGLEYDTVDTIRDTISYALSLNTYLARFSISTPYPGTEFFEKLNKESRLLTHDYEKYTQFNLVYKHQNLTPDQTKFLLEYAYRRYYFRPRFFLNLMKWKIREYWL
jgi:radical SAM superfamily enzyme YgiQ (UPF0313 family)